MTASEGPPTSMRGPRFTILTPVYNPPVEVLADTIASVCQQTFTDWEWVVVDDCSPDEEVRNVLRRAAAGEPRIRLIERAENGHIVAASNTGLQAARGEFVCLLDHDDLLVAHALERVDEVLSLAPEADLVYSDEDKRVGRRRFGAFRKPDWSPQRLRGHMYTGHLCVVRRQLVEQVGGFRPGFDGSQDHDLTLRVSEVARQVVHIPEILYHWRVVDGSAAGDVGAKPYAWVVGAQAIDDHMRRLGVGRGELAHRRVGYYRTIAELPAHRSLSLVLLSAGGLAEVGAAPPTTRAEASLASVIEHSDHPLLEVILVVDSATSSQTVRRLSTRGVPLRVVRVGAGASSAERINRAALVATGERLVLLDERTSAESPDWIGQLVGALEEPGVGLVGPLVLDQHNEVRYAGHRYHSGRYEHVFVGTPHGDGGDWGALLVGREVSGLALAVAAVRRSDFLAVGGLTERIDPAAAEVDFSLKIRRSGLRAVWLPHVVARTVEPPRAREVSPTAAKRLVQWWGEPDFDPYLPF